MYLDGYSIHGIQQQAPLKMGRDLIENAIIEAGHQLRGLAQNGKPFQVELARATSIQRFGYANASSSPRVKKKREATFLHRYGVANPFQDKKIKQKIIITNIERYGHPYPGTHAKQRVKISSPHQLLSSALMSVGIDHVNEVVVYRQDVFSKNKAPRIDITIGNFAIEVFGDYFHANPLKYRASDLISRFSGKVEAAKIWEEDALRLQKLRQCGYHTMVVWERDIKTDLPTVINRIQNELEHHQD